jgi:hypothetical protein
MQIYVLVGRRRRFRPIKSHTLQKVLFSALRRLPFILRVYPTSCPYSHIGSSHSVLVAELGFRASCFLCLDPPEHRLRLCLRSHFYFLLFSFFFPFSFSPALTLAPCVLPLLGAILHSPFCAGFILVFESMCQETVSVLSLQCQQNPASLVPPFSLLPLSCFPTSAPQSFPHGNAISSTKLGRWL